MFPFICLLQCFFFAGFYGLTRKKIEFKKTETIRNPNFTATAEGLNPFPTNYVNGLIEKRIYKFFGVIIVGLQYEVNGFFWGGDITNIFSNYGNVHFSDRLKGECSVNTMNAN